MPEEANTRATFVFPASRKGYVLASVIYGVAAIGSIISLRPPVLPDSYQPNWAWTLWLDIAIAGYCIWFLCQLLSALSNRIEKLICLLTLICFALSVPENLHTLGYRWAQLRAGNWIYVVLAILAALLVFFRTFQVFTSPEAEA